MYRSFLAFFLLVLSQQGCSAPPGQGREPSKIIPLPGIKGRIDHLCFDPDSNRLFLVSPGSNSFAEVDLENGKELFVSSEHLDEPQGILYLRRSNRIIITNGGTGTCCVFDAHSHQLVQTLPLGDDADNIRYLPSKGEIYIAYGGGGIAVFSENDFRKLRDIPLNGHPEAFQLDTLGQKMYVNIPARGVVDEIDLVQNVISHEWKLSAGGNFPMGIDGADHLLFIGCRSGSKMIVVDYASGKEITTVETGSDADDIFYDDANKRVIISCGGGETRFFSLVHNSLTASEKLLTGTGARTCLLISSLHLLVVAKPGHLGNEGTLLVYPL